MRPVESIPKTAKRRGERTEGGRFARSASNVLVRPAITVRPQTAQEGRQFSAALDLLLSELVRQELERGRKRS